MENSATLNRDTTVRFVHDFDRKTLQGCLERFKEQKALPFGGFPGIGRTTLAAINKGQFLTTGPEVPRK